jgi:hypothetical protein
MRLDHDLDKTGVPATHIAVDEVQNLGGVSDDPDRATRRAPS